MTDTKWPCKMSKNIWRNMLIIVVIIYLFFSIGCLFVSRKIKRIAFTPNQQKAENSRTVEKRCHLMFIWRWIHQHPLCAVRSIIQFRRKKLIFAAKWCSKFLNQTRRIPYQVDCVKEDEKLYLNKVQTVSKIEQNNKLLQLSDPHSA